MPIEKRYVRHRLPIVPGVDAVEGSKAGIGVKPVKDKTHI